MWLVLKSILKGIIPAFFSAIFSFIILGMLGIVGLYVYFSPQLPDTQTLRHIDLQVPLRIYSRENRLIAEYGTQRSRPVKLSEVPDKLRLAFIAIEDSRYYDHPGIDIVGVVRAFLSVMSTGSASQGASTITMQLARNAFLDHDKTISRKLREILLATRMEQNFSKDEILELYLNKIYLGNRATGIAAAAETYYGKENLYELTLAQMAMIAGLPKAPSRYNPIVNPPRAMIRRNYILLRMLELGFIHQTEYDEAIKEPNTAAVHKPDVQTYAPYLAEMVRQSIIKRYADQAYKQGLHVYTTLDSNMQADAMQALRATLDEYDQRHGYRAPEEHINLDALTKEEWLDKLANHPPIGDLQSGLVLNSNQQMAQVQLVNEQVIELNLKDVQWARPFITADRRGATPKKVSDVLKRGDIIRVRQVTPADIKTDQHSNNKSNEPSDAAPISTWQLAQIPSVSAALVLMNPKDGAVRAILGGYDFYHSKFNRATQAMRQPGSSFKPIIYAAGLSRGFTPKSVVNDAPISIPGSNWQPKNFGGSYIGPTTLSEALAKSRNLVSIRVLRDTGIDYTINYATRFGFAKENLPRNLTLALGTGLTTPLQMATAYSSFANGGFKIAPHFITRIEDHQGRVLYDATQDIQMACGDVQQCIIPTQTAQHEANETNEKQTSTDSDSPEAADKTEVQTITLPAAKRIMDSTTAHNIVSMMQGVTRFGTAAKAGRTLKRKDLAGKTGTTNKQRDAWFCGFNPTYVAVAWVGFDDMSELGEGETSTKVAVPMWIKLMKPVLQAIPEQAWKKPEKLQTVSIDADTGLLATENSLNVIEEGKALPRAVAPAQVTQSFEYQNENLPAPAATIPSYPQAIPMQQPRQPERVEIPEQIF